jgi:hypothetical protein
MKRFLVPAALVLGGVVAALLLCEIALRAMGFSAPIWHRPDPRLGWTLRPGIAAWFTQEGRAYVQVNAAGQRDRSHALHKPADVYRIAVLGDSYSEAMQVARDEAYWALLPPRLEACGFAPGKRVEVLNFGVSGYGTAQQLVMLESTAMRYRPDLVLLQFTNGNDVKDNSFALDEKKARPFFMLEPDGTLRLDESFAAAPGFRRSASWILEAFRQASDRSRVLQLVRSAKHVAFVRKAQADGAEQGVEQGLEPVVLAPPRDALWEEAWRITEGAIARIDEYARRNGARLMVVTVPYAIQVHPEPKVRHSLQAKLGVADLFYPDQRIAEFSKRSGIAALPLALEMQRLAEEQGAYFHGFPASGMGRGHWNAAGHRTAADLIAKQLCAQPS